ncbi:hypothetical protein ELQ90_03120 [Labedella phragmitis]|uniref:Uncharacterized protein n=1 Tax=Labedella phragmitis TaxID=2498849 RepID=A0A444PYR8_9MICO|nr:hypothetical protein [Labedella phragmitis]RWZ52941.1 hypothetical protein ELQ90_03120 [Labedella phragmitis]
MQALAEGVEAALRAAGVPAATNPDAIVAATAAARDAHFGVPTTSASQLALQRRGASAIRTDRGWTERYFALYNASTNPGGARQAGWYPVAGRVPVLDNAVVTTTSMDPNVWTPKTGMFRMAESPLVNHGGWSFGDDSITPPFPGVYDISARVGFTGRSGGTTRAFRAEVNGRAYGQDIPRNTAYTGSGMEVPLSTTVVVLPGESIKIVALHDTTTALPFTLPRLTVKYAEPV